MSRFAYSSFSYPSEQNTLAISCSRRRPPSDAKTSSSTLAVTLINSSRNVTEIMRCSIAVLWHIILWRKGTQSDLSACGVNNVGIVPLGCCCTGTCVVVKVWISPKGGIIDNQFIYEKVILAYKIINCRLVDYPCYDRPSLDREPNVSLLQVQ